MHTQSIDLVWIKVKDFQQALKFYTETAGLKIVEKNEEWGWAELEGYEGKGMRLGIAQHRAESDDPVQPGQNGVVAFTVKNIDVACEELKSKEANLIGAVVEVPGHVKMQTVSDVDGNIFQIVEVLSESCDSKTQTKGSCCSH